MGWNHQPDGSSAIYFYPGGFIFIAYPKWSEQCGRINKDQQVVGTNQLWIERLNFSVL